MYQLIFIFLLFFSLIEVFTGKKSKIGFKVAFSLLTFVAVFRYGQMDDYFSYYWYYEAPDIYTEIDPLYGALTIFFKSLSVPYVTFVAMMSLLCMAIIYRFFSKDCGYSCLSLFIFYSYTFLVCCPMGAFRQGLCLAILLFMYHSIKRQNNFAFYFSVLVGCFIHLSFVVVLIIPYIMKLKIYNKTFVIYIVLGLIVFAFAGGSFAQFLQYDRIAYYQEAEGMSIWMRMLLRILIILPIVLYKPNYGTDGYYSKAICLVGFAIYCLLSFNVLVSARLEYYFRTFICLFAAYLVSNFRWNFRIGTQLCLILLIHGILWYKNIETEIVRMDYKEDTTVLNFPFISIFDKSEYKEYSGMESYGLDDG